MNIREKIVEARQALAEINTRILIAENSDNDYALSGRMDNDYAERARAIARLERLERK